MLKTIIYEKYQHEEEQYLAIVKDILENGKLIKGRNGNTISLNGSSMYFSLENQKIPILTTKKVAVKTCIKELLWFINGKTDNKLLKEQNVHIWDGNGSKDFLESRGLDYKEDDLGPVYGHQWRHFNAKYKTCDENYKNEGIDQLEKIISSLKDPNERFSRRLVMSAWNPCQIDEMALPPCHILCQFNVNNDNELSCSMYQRSGDIGLGVPFNIMSYSVLTHLIAHHCGLKAKEFIYHIGNCHIYDDHIDQMNIQCLRKPYEFPNININTKYDDINNYTLDNFEISNYKCHEKIKMDMRK
jgi:thymidylate synthase